MCGRARVGFRRSFQLLFPSSKIVQAVVQILKRRCKQLQTRRTIHSLEVAKNPHRRTMPLKSQQCSSLASPGPREATGPLHERHVEQRLHIGGLCRRKCQHGGGTHFQFQKVLTVCRFVEDLFSIHGTRWASRILKKMPRDCKNVESRKLRGAGPPNFRPQISQQV